MGFFCCFICAFGFIKEVVVCVNYKLGKLDDKLVMVIWQVVMEVVDGVLDEYFFVDIFQIGLGMFINMNINEVIVNWVIEILGGEIGSKSLVYFNDYVNDGQLFNDVILMVLYIVGVEVLYVEFVLVLCWLQVFLEVKV